MVQQVQNKLFFYEVNEYLGMLSETLLYAFYGLYFVV